MPVSLPELVEKKRAKKAYDFITSLNVPENAEVCKKFNSYVKSAPTLILSNGLLQTLAFYDSNKGSNKPREIAYQKLLDAINTLVLNSKEENLQIHCINDYDVSQYRFYTKETLACLLWLKRFAEAVLPSDEEDDDGNTEG